MIIQGKLTDSSCLVNVKVQGEGIADVSAADGRFRPDFGGPDFFICTGFFDPQVNGFGGVDFNGKGFSAEALHRAALALASSGVTSYLPTLTTAPRERTLAQL